MYGCEKCETARNRDERIMQQCTSSRITQGVNLLSVWALFGDGNIQCSRRYYNKADNDYCAMSDIWTRYGVQAVNSGLIRTGIYARYN